MKIKMRYLRQTKGTYVYESVDLPAAIPVVYLRKEEVSWTSAPTFLDLEFVAVEEQSND